jgi:hypothetical protein
MIRAVAARMRSAGSPCKTPGNRNPGAVKDSLTSSSNSLSDLFSYFTETDFDNVPSNPDRIQYLPIA